MGPYPEPEHFLGLERDRLKTPNLNPEGSHRLDLGVPDHGPRSALPHRRVAQRLGVALGISHEVRQGFAGEILVAISTSLTPALFHGELLSKAIAELLRDQPPHDVGRSPAGKRQQLFDGLGRPIGLCSDSGPCLWLRPPCWASKTGHDPSLSRAQRCPVARHGPTSPCPKMERHGNQLLQA